MNTLKAREFSYGSSSFEVHLEEEHEHYHSFLQVAEEQKLHHAYSTKSGSIESEMIAILCLSDSASVIWMNRRLILCLQASPRSLDSFNFHLHFEAEKFVLRVSSLSSFSTVGRHDTFPLEAHIFRSEAKQNLMSK